MVVGGKTKAEQVRSTGAALVVTPCANSKKQMGELLEDHHVPCARIGLHDLLLKAIELGPPPAAGDQPGADRAPEAKA